MLRVSLASHPLGSEFMMAFLVSRRLEIRQLLNDTLIWLERIKSIEIFCGLNCGPF